VFSTFGASFESLDEFEAESPNAAWIAIRKRIEEFLESLGGQDAA
jgi:hypothetical protein